jgi:hypothetical protein
MTLSSNFFAAKTAKNPFFDDSLRSVPQQSWINSSAMASSLSVNIVLMVDEAEPPSSSAQMEC